ncbi:RagB/SusD family nutrient uptake outer membrane protein [Chitinophaga defluvii]|uniref:RagB/SusD family nutrient uptake outer membrane protein n=1 Tax=Chitinophaga defluvii TaxID=3163343 RepID=A0ABV2T5X7_9BACT
MLRKVYISFLLTGLLCISSCKSFLDVKPIDRLSDNSFWNTKQDVESAVADTYGAIFDLITNGPYNFANGDLRAGEVSWDGERIVCFEAVGENDLGNATRMGNPERYVMLKLSDWYPFFQSIAACNIDIERIPQVKALSAADSKQYLAEVRFVRAFTYFYISRLYGDVPLYTKAYDKDPLPRTPMLKVLQFCLEELEAIKEDLPWQYDDPAKWGVRAARGAVYALIANVNMWMAGFDKANEQQYWKATVEAVQEVVNSGKFGLLPIEDFHTLFKGRTKESLFEFSVNANYGATTKYVTPGQWMTHEPVIVYSYSWAWFKGDFMKKLFPPDKADRRRDLWFYLPYASTIQTMFLKYSNVSDPVNWFFDDNLMMFRYGGLLLLGAEAMADMGMNNQAITLLNLVRKRAGAKLYEASDGDLKDFIFSELQRELVGEGSRWYDLVRTGRVMDPNQCANSLTPEQFSRGAWTWPIDPKARVNNPNITLNSYWAN